MIFQESSVSIKVVMQFFIKTYLQKLKDPRSFTIPISIEKKKSYEIALYDLGAHINIKSLSIFEIFDLEEVQPTNITLQLKDS